MQDIKYQYQNIFETKFSTSSNYKTKNFIQYERKKENKIIGNKLLFCLLFLFYLIIPVLSQSKNKKHRKIFDPPFDEETPNSEISIKINGTGYQRLISNDDLCPDEIYINETKVGENECMIELTNPLTVIRMLWLRNLTTCQEMFLFIDNIIWIDLSKFDSSLITSTHWMFLGCNSLISINFNNFNTSLVTDMGGMFHHCNSLISINLANFNTSLVSNMEWMFWGCNSLLSINLSNFNTTLVTDMGSMFRDCSSLISINLSTFNTSLVTNMGGMLSYCSSLRTINLSNFDTSQLIYMGAMFLGCSSLKSINLSNFITSHVRDIGGIFWGCDSLISFDLTNFDTSFVTNMGGMFFDCKSLTSINITHFNTSLVDNMSVMFKGCSSVKSINLSNFNTSLVKNMEQMFFGCNSLISLDLNNFDTSSVLYMNKMFADCSVLNSLYIANFDMSLIEDMEKMFSGLSSLIILDLTNFNIPVELDINNTFIDLNTNLTYCINEKKNTDLSSQLSSFQNDCYKVCLTNPNKKFIIEKNKCLDNCYDDNFYKFEYNRLCYENCPDGTNAPLTNSFLCKNITFETLTNKIDKIEEEIKECNIIDFINNLCKMSDNKEVNIKNIKNQLMNGTLNLLIDNLIGGEKKDLLVKEDSAIYQITSSENQNNKQYYNLSTIKLGECENILKKENNITDNETLLIFKYDYFIEGSLIPIINYEIYHPVTKQKLNLGLCNDELINLNIPVSINESNLLLPK